MFAQYVETRCSECDCLLFSQHAKSTGLCPECENESIEHNQNTDWFELEALLEENLK